jgi:spore coat protein A
VSTRRTFLKTTAITGVGTLLLSSRAWPFDQSPTNITKYAVTLPGLGPGGANNLGNYIQVLSNTTPGTGTDNYELVAHQFTQQLHPNLSPTTFWGYADASIPYKGTYLGGVIVATRHTPAKLQVTNLLPPLHILPVDTTLVDPIMSAEVGGRTDRIAVHLHGGFVTWPNDGGPFHWFSNANNPGGFVHGSSFIPNSTPGSFIYNYPNDQSARLMWYHDHAYSITRTNAFAGIATAYLLTDADEAVLISSGVLPEMGDISALYTYGIPLVIQDKTFWDGPGGEDPNYAAAVPAGAKRGSLWYPHVYEGASAANLPAMSLPPACGTGTARWELDGTPPSISTVPEYFSDTILVNGGPYPVLPVPPRRLRFRFLNGSQARFYNLQLYVADGTADGITLAQTRDIDNNGNPILAPTNPPGPAFIQIGNEAGFLPAPALFTKDGSNINSNRVIGYKLVGSAPGDPTVGNVNRYNLVIAPAERPDVIIDFRGFEGRSLILYNDAPAPFPGGDIRNDYYAGDFDLTCIGGAPSTKPGFGPDTRILMKFVVGTSGQISELSFPDTITALQNALPIYFANNQPTFPKPTGMAKVKTLNEDFDSFGRLRQRLGAPAVSDYLATPVDFAQVGESQQWQIFNLTADTHPMHFHLVNVQVVSRAAWKFDSSGSPLNGKLTPIPGTARPPDPNEMGYKETVRMNPGEVVTVNMMFNMPTGAPSSPRLQSMYGINGAEYVWHCHILEHEEHDMMHALVVTGGTT